MTKKMVWIMLLGCLFILSACQTTTDPDPDDHPDPIVEPVQRQVVEPNDTIYQVLVYAFADSDGDGIGDFKGIYEHIDYFKYLGINSLWLSPVHPSPSYHGYDVTDYYSIKDIYVVDDYDFEDLVTDLAKEDIDVIMDMVINHASNKHPYFIVAQQAYIYDNDSPYIDYFRFSKTNFTNPVYGYDAAYSRGVYYDAFYGYSSMPDWNFDNQAVRDMFLDVFNYWLDMGVAGFRLDAAKHIYNYEVQNVALLKYFKQTLAETYDDVFFVNEVWASEDDIIDYYQSEMQNLDFTFRTHSLNALHGSTYLSAYLDQFQAAIRDAYADANEVPFLSNHDVGRAGNNLSVRDNKMLASLLLLAPGNSLIYYGDDIMLAGTRVLNHGYSGYDDASYRTPMLWDSDTTKTAPYIFEGTNNAIQQARTISDLTVSDAMDDTDSILNHYQKVIDMKHDHPLLSLGTLTYVDLDDSLISYQVCDDDDALLVIHNLSDQPIDVNIPVAFTISDYVTTTQAPIKVDDQLMVPSYSSIIVHLDEPLEISTTPIVDQVFILGSMTNWQISSLFEMTYVDGVYHYVMIVNELIEFKIFVNDHWYGYDDILLPDTSFLSREAGNGNIQIQPGQYEISFSNHKITITLA